MSKLPTNTITEGSGALTDDWDLYFGEFDLTGFDLDPDKSAFLPPDLSTLSTAELLLLCDQAFEELDTPFPGPTARDNYSVLSEELNKRQDASEPEY
ncbi:hypothetical protein P4U43_13800 [Arthrobacter sp. EH-1B-1]|uniref:Uncharacterized protein n=1 Tax=Arthrobacter vasquezii TaxID=2977629 RepID=A0ABT6CXQ1_9MICC|nr:hypothetical protein [Arthrobacter vasquezii]MDF9278860.1 hypothetical protein [Arthrobacter vasquezii]